MRGGFRQRDIYRGGFDPDVVAAIGGMDSIERLAAGGFNPEEEVDSDNETSTAGGSDPDAAAAVGGVDLGETCGDFDSDEEASSDPDEAAAIGGRDLNEMCGDFDLDEGADSDNETSTLEASIQILQQA